MGIARQFANHKVETMLLFGVQPEQDENNWRRKLDKFVRTHQQEFAALAWGLFLERGEENNQVLGIDIEPMPRFVYCSREAIDTLNHNVKNHIQEILGVLDAHQPEKDVVMLAIGAGEIKLIHFDPEPTPPICFEQVATDVDTLLERLEKGLSEQMKAGVSDETA